MLTTIFTAFALIFSLSAAGVAGFFAARAANDSDELAAGLRRLQGVRDELAAMQVRLDKLAGRVYANWRRAPVTVEGELYSAANGADDDADPDLAAQLALQSAPAASPGKSR
jgi:hypothetical protein